MCTRGLPSETPTSSSLIFRKMEQFDDWLPELGDPVPIYPHIPVEYCLVWGAVTL